MMLSLIYGVYIMFFDSPKPTKAVTTNGDRELEELNKFITKIADKTKVGLSQRQSYVLEKAGLAWKRGPFDSDRGRKSRRYRPGDRAGRQT